MCPACISMTTVLIAGTTSAGGLTLLLVKIRARLARTRLGGKVKTKEQEQ